MPAPGPSMQPSQTLVFDAHAAGVDESGRGPLAGPVVAAAVILDVKRPIDGLRDSKQLTARRRERLAAHIRADALAWSVAWASVAEIDLINILQASLLAMRRAILGLPAKQLFVFVDGNRLPDLSCRGRGITGEAVVRGDCRIPAISAASILAKTLRDSIMTEIDSRFPQYGFARHKGYGTELHRRRLHEFGPCAEHRRSFEPIKSLS